MNPFQSLRSYEIYVYSLPQTYPLIERSTLVVARRGMLLATVQGELMFAQSYRWHIFERLNLLSGGVQIAFYGYELWQGNDTLTWYDPQPHPHIPELQATHPHHKHIPPDIKHHRIIAPNMSFNQPNLSVLIEEVQTLIEKTA